MKTISSLAVAALLFAASPANGQTPAAPPTNAPAPAPAPVPAATQAAGASGSYWALIGGYEWDTHGSSYGFVGPAYTNPIRSNLAWTARVFGNYLRYEFTSAAGTTKVKSPGANGALGLQFGEKHTLGIMAGPAVSWRETEVTSSTGVVTETDETRWGANVAGEVSLNPTTTENVLGIVNYNTTDDYLWARLGAKTQITNRSWSGPTAVAIGIEGIGQGNEDIKSTQIGGLLEVAHSPSKFSLMFRAGYKRSTFEVGPNKTGPYFGVGFYKRFN
jgi:outer membrane protein assembly factor BamA